MKRVFYFLFVAIFAMSCEEPMGYGSEDPDALWNTKDFNINRWTLDRSGEFYYAEYSVGALTEYVYRNGIIAAYVETNGNYKTPLPYTRFYKEQSGYTWGEVIDFTFSPGNITFYATPSDLNTTSAPESLRIRVVMVW